MWIQVVVGFLALFFVGNCGGGGYVPPIHSKEGESSAASSSALIQIQIPPRGAILSASETEVRGELKADLQTVTVNDQAADIQGSEFRLSSLTLREGQNPILASAVTKDGREVIDQLMVTADWTPPKIRFRDSAMGTRTVCSLVISPEFITVEDLNPGSHRFTMNDRAVEGVVRERNPGRYKLVVEAVDAAGNRAREEKAYEISGGPDCEGQRQFASYFDKQSSFFQNFLDELVSPQVSGRSSDGLLGWWMEVGRGPDETAQVRALVDGISKDSLEELAAFLLVGPANSAAWRRSLSEMLGSRGFENWFQESLPIWGRKSETEGMSILEGAARTIAASKVWSDFHRAGSEGYIRELTSIAEGAGGLGLVTAIHESLLTMASPAQEREWSDRLGSFLDSTVMTNTFKWFQSGGADRLQVVGSVLADANYEGKVFRALQSLDRESFSELATRVSAVSDPGKDPSPLERLFRLAGELERRMRQAGHEETLSRNMYAFVSLRRGNQAASPSALEEMLASLEEGSQPARCLSVTLSENASETFLGSVAEVGLKKASDSFLFKIMKLAGGVPGACTLSESQLSRWRELAEFALEHEETFAPFERMVRVLRGSGSQQNLIPEFLAVNHELIRNSVYSAMRPLILAAADSGLMDVYVRVLSEQPAAARELAVTANWVSEPCSDRHDSVASELIRHLGGLVQSNPRAVRIVSDSLQKGFRENPSKVMTLADSLDSFMSKKEFPTLSGRLLRTWRQSLGGSFSRAEVRRDWVSWFEKALTQKRFSPILEYFDETLSGREGERAISEMVKWFDQRGDRAATVVAGRLGQANFRPVQVRILSLAMRWASGTGAGIEALSQLARDRILASSLLFALELTP